MSEILEVFDTLKGQIPKRSQDAGIWTETILFGSSLTEERVIALLKGEKVYQFLSIEHGQPIKTNPWSSMVQRYDKINRIVILVMSIQLDNCFIVTPVALVFTNNTRCGRFVKENNVNIHFLQDNIVEANQPVVIFKGREKVEYTENL